MKLNENEMEKVVGGGLSWGAIAGLASGIVFIIGLLSGYTNPTKCKN